MIMKTLKCWPFLMTAFLCMAGTAQSAVIASGETGIGSVANITFDKTDLKSDAPVSIHTGTNFTPPEQNIPYVKPSLVPMTKSDAWCDPSANPLQPENTSYDLCYGNAYDARWIVLDFNKLKKQGIGKVAVSITAKRYTIGDINLPINNLVPALAVFQGLQNQGAWGKWFPNTFQTTPPFWGWKLTPFKDGATESAGWATAYTPTGGQSEITVDGVLKLVGGNNNYLSVAVGGDARDPANIHDVNFELAVKVAKYVAPKPGPSPNSCPNGIVIPPGYDACGCKTGTHWHPQMNHCMADALFAGYEGEMVTGAQCAACGCVKTLAFGKCP
jgi:hypothetical protein